MNKAAWRKTWKWLQVLVLVYLGVGALFYFFQDKLIFRPKKLAADYSYSFDIPFREINMPISETKNLSIVQFTVEDSIQKGIVLYFHGNRGNINRYAPAAGSFTRNGYEVWMIDYPGYGKSTGKRTEQILYEDALTMYNLALRQMPVENLIIYGRSLGSGIAAHLSSTRESRHLILETPYYSMPHLARYYFFMYPAMLLSRFEFSTYAYIEHTRSPITIFHGTKDRVIPYKHARWLSEIKPGIELVTIEKGGHNNLSEFPAYRQKLDSILK
jgi:pimeloyl-ACP methyl ester carboxylesterase